jgi:hypothetical protein
MLFGEYVPLIVRSIIRSPAVDGLKLGIGWADKLSTRQHLSTGPLSSRMSPP